MGLIFRGVVLVFLIALCGFDHQATAIGVDTNLTATIFVNASAASGRKIPDTLFGVFFEEINHAGAGGLWAELVSNRGFEAGGSTLPSFFGPWAVIGDDSKINVSTDKSSCFDRNKIALKMEVLCDNQGKNVCPAGGVGIYNPGYWGMNIEQGKTYKVVFYIRSPEAVNVSVSLTSSNGSQTLASTNFKSDDVSNWTKAEVRLDAKTTDHNARLQLTTNTKGVIWFDQVSAMPTDTYKGYGFRNDLVQMIADLKPRFIRFPGGCFVEGEHLRNAFRWKETIGPWEERPGHSGDVWNYWTDDGLGYYEFLLLAEALDTAPVWVVNNGISHTDEVDTSIITPYVKEMLDSLEFARGDANSTWGSVRAAMGHKEPFDLKYVAVGNEDCGKRNYRGNYMKFYDAIKKAYPDIKIISNCDGSDRPLDHPADLYDYHIYDGANNVFAKAHKFDRTSRSGPKAFVSEYAVTGNDARYGSFLAALAESAFLIGLERNSDIIEMASYAPLFVNVNDRKWNPDAVVFNSFQAYGTPSYWMQQFFSESSGATLLQSQLKADSSSSLVASAIAFTSSEDQKDYLRIKVVNFGGNTVNLKVSIDGIEPNLIQSQGSTKTVLTSTNLMDENSFDQPKKISPDRSPLKEASDQEMNVVLSPHSLNCFDLSLDSSIIRMPGSDSFRRHIN